MLELTGSEVRPLKSFFHESCANLEEEGVSMTRTLSIWRWQLIFTAGMIAIAVAIAAFSPRTFGNPYVVSGFGTVLATTVVTIAAPWSRLPRWTAALVPFLDALAIGLTTNVAEIRLGFLWVFPITWLAAFFTLPWIFGCIGFIMLCLVLFSGHTGTQTEIVLRVLTVLITLSFLGVSIRLGMRRARASGRLLKRQSEQAARAAERAETQQLRVTQIIDALDIALVVVTAGGRIVKMNDAYRVLYGRDRFGAVLPSASVEYDDRRGNPVPPERTTLARASAGRLLAGERVWLFDSEGAWHALDVSTHAMAGDTEPTTLVIIDDVTALIEADEERAAITAVVSHELRNPLTAIIGHADLLLERDDLPERVRGQLEVIMNAGERMQRLVTSALDDPRSDDTEHRPVDLRDVVDASAASFAAIAAAAGITLEVGGAREVTILGDAFRLRQVLDNLLSNALKYTSAHGTVTVTLADASAPEIVIADTGGGIAENDLARLFEPYFRTESAIRAGIPGTGLGMGIARDIVALHGGTIEVASVVGDGTRVILRFPAPPAPRPDDPKADS